MGDRVPTMVRSINNPITAENNSISVGTAIFLGGAILGLACNIAWLPNLPEHLTNSYPYLDNPEQAKEAFTNMIICARLIASGADASVIIAGINSLRRK